MSLLKSWTMYGHETQEGGRKMFEDIYESSIQVKMCGHLAVSEIELALAEDGETDVYFGWQDSSDGNVSMVYSDEALVDMCFPYGVRAAQEHGEGRVVKLRVVSSSPCK